ncbi:type I restriction endonuclease subunit R [Metabacillus sp. KIGAM252]|uniref:type I site-specific deoxyribonuclease n=1 Tax=Metabacillus flavus TaxID=2823519 RepID=A0ABS5LII3_9BACI|nr:DEAD/DEAH box helicase family protein [Metabacillus flavus]MBS2970542.1 type I restriction endonuclease subunit R [Metabacillus flavus]
MAMGRPEDSRVKIPALAHFTRMGYSYMSLKGKDSGVAYDADTNIFFDLFRNAINQINNTDYTISDVRKIVEELKVKLSNDDHGRAFFSILQDGFDGIRLIDFTEADKNNYTIVTELPYVNNDGNFRPDIIVLLNGMPLSFVEVKRQNNREGILVERDRMTRRFANPIYRRFVNLTQFTVFSNNNEYDDTVIAPIQGAFYASSNYGKMFFSKFREQRSEELHRGIQPLDKGVEDFILKDTNLIAIKGTPEYQSSMNPDSPTNRIITSLYSRERLLFFMKYGICYKETTDKNGIKHIEKHIMRYPQIFATFAIRDSLAKGVKKGVIWHTQGSGKTALAYSNVKFLKDYYQRNNQIAKFYFIVDRLDLATQAKNEFEARGLLVEIVDSKEEFKNNISAVGESNKSGKITINLVNIQKFSNDTVVQSADYNVNIQRVYFMDEAHRSYNPQGSFLANLMASDRNAVMIALTGTPLIGDGFNTKNIFGNYIHKYYYNQSIADGYTLKLIREEIETTYRTMMQDTLKELEVMKGSISKKDMYAHPKFVSAMVEYILKDFHNSRISLGDDTIGAMVVCDSSEQARAVTEELQKQTEFSYALVLHDEGTKQDRRDIQDDFKKAKIDILVVYNMLLTGFDAPRLKKQYLCRMIKAHNLLQTLTRVNRPYKDFQYGFVVDFANIKNEFDKTNKAYFEELEAELGDEVQNYSDIFKSREEIETDLEDVKNQLFLYNTNNVVEFINQINQIDDKEQLLNLRRALENYKLLNNLIKLYGFDDLYIRFDVEKALKLLAEVNNRIATINFKQQLESVDDVSSVLNTAMDQIDFQFRKIKDEELVIADTFRDSLEKTRKEIVERSLDPKDPEYIDLLDELKRVFKKKNIEELTADEMKELTAKLDGLRKRAERKNHADRMLSAKYNGDNKYMRTHKRVMASSSSLANDMVTHKILMKIKEKADEKIAHNQNLLDNEPFFILSLQPFIINACKEQNVSVNLEQITFIDNCIAQEYFIERNWTA